MKQLKSGIVAVMLLAATVASAQTTIVKHFDKVIVSPYIQVTFVEGNEESVTVEKCSVPADKLNIEVKSGTLRIYLEGAKELDKGETTYENGYKQRHSLYSGTIVTATVTYKTLDELSIRGEEKQVCQSPLKGKQFRLKIYGESNVYLNEVDLGELHATLYGESNLEIKSGSIDDQKYTVYGESKINALGIEGSTSKITAYGEAEFKMNVSDEIKMTAFGEASLAYKRNPKINKWLHFGEIQVSKLD
ncbi:MAG: head GIN domain-containing protein [Bacteroidota bacterium]